VDKNSLNLVTIIKKYFNQRLGANYQHISIQIDSFDLLLKIHGQLNTFTSVDSITVVKFLEA